ncbi:hypothetical protein [Agromyces lapidis]|uniref:Lipoprotein n=1 Tax=Agromyces lapidis TaxID=279574 RepID=A0ABV5SPD3_9MICO|nr:hypothetical protein [Agromyces lapidis]
MRASLQSLIVAAASLLVVAGLSACTAAGAPDGSAEPTAAPTAAPTTSASATPTDSPAPTSVAVTCDTVLAPEAYAQLESDGLTPRDPIAHTEFMGAMLDAGALGCRWGKEATDLSLDVARLTVDDATWPEWEVALTAAGYTLTDDPVPGAYTGPVDPGTGLSPVVVKTDDAIVYVGAPVFAGWIASPDESE